MTKHLLLVLLLATQVTFAQHQKGELTAKYLKSDEAIREDEYANSLKRRDWLKDRLILSAGAGSKYAVWGAGFPSFGVGVEYITQWHVGAFVSAGYIFPSKDSSFPDTEPQKAGAANYRYGLTYTLFPKLALHPGISISYGHSFYDHLKNSFVTGPQYFVNGEEVDVNVYVNTPDIVEFPALPANPQTNPVKNKEIKENQTLRDAAGNAIPTEKREILFTDGFQFELTVTYMTSEWYYFSLNVGASYSGKPGSSTNKSGEVNPDGSINSFVMGDTKNGISEWNPVISAGVGFALPEFNPDKTEIRRRQRESARNKLGL